MALLWSLHQGTNRTANTGILGGLGVTVVRIVRDSEQVYVSEWQTQNRQQRNAIRFCGQVSKSRNRPARNGGRASVRTNTQKPAERTSNRGARRPDPVAAVRTGIMVLKGYHAKGNGTGCQPPVFAGAGSERVSVATIWDWPGLGRTVRSRSFHRGPLGPVLAAVPRYG